MNTIEKSNQFVKGLIRAGEVAHALSTRHSNINIAVNFDTFSVELSQPAEENLKLEYTITIWNLAHSDADQLARLISQRWSLVVLNYYKN